MIRISILAALSGVSMALGAIQSIDQAAASQCVALCDPSFGAAGSMREPLVYESETRPPETVVASAPPVGSPPILDPLEALPLAFIPLKDLSGGEDPAATREFVRQAAMSDNLELRASLVARVWAKDPEVKALAERVIAERRANRESLSRLAQTADVGIAAEAFDAIHAAQLTKMRLGETGSLDQAYLDLLADSRAKAAAYFEVYAANGEDPALIRYAERRLVTLRRQLSSLEQLTTG